jgi:AcrR family transcriptional regulator
VTFEPLTPERRRAMTRQHLLDAAAIVFAEHGFHRATLDQVAATAGFTKGAVYSNFASKDDLFLALLDDRTDRQMAILVEVMETDEPTSDRVGRARQLLHSGTFFWDDAWSALYLEFVVYARHRPDARAKLAAMAERSRAYVAEIIEHAYAAAGVTPEHPPRELAVLSLALFEGLGIHRIIDPVSIGDGIIDAALAVLADAMRT